MYIRIFRHYLFIATRLLTSWQDGNPIPVEPSGYFFGPVSLDLDKMKNQSNPTFEPPAANDRGPDQRATTTTKTVLADANGQPATATESAVPKKDHRKMNGHNMEIDSNGTVPAKGTPSPVVDGDGDVSMDTAPDQEPPPAEQPQPPPPPNFTLTNGNSVGVQITPAKAADLGPNTSILDVAGRDHVMHALWCPHDPTVMAAAGEMFCSLWKLSLSSSPNPVQEVLFDGGDAEGFSCISAVAWDAAGQKLAVATYSSMKGSITMYDVQGNAVDLLPEVPRMITGLHWSQQSSHLVVVASDSKVTELALWDNSLRPDEFPPPIVIDKAVYDFVWLDRSRAYACGDGGVYECEVDSSIHVSRVFSEGDMMMTPWTYVRCTQRNATPQPLVVAASAETAKIWIPSHDMNLDDAHQGEITAIEFRPDPSESNNAPIILASSSTDDTVKVWNVNLESKRLECIHRLFLGTSTPALASSFSPDGYAIAAASKDKVFIWNAERGGAPMATWTAPNHEEETTKREDGPDHEVDGRNGSVELMPIRSLSWDSNGKKLAFGFDSQVCSICILSCLKWETNCI